MLNLFLQYNPCSALAQCSEVLLWNVWWCFPFETAEAVVHCCCSYSEYIQCIIFLRVGSELVETNAPQEALKSKLDSPFFFNYLHRLWRKNNLNCELNSGLPAAIYMEIVQYFLFSPTEDSPLSCLDTSLLLSPCGSSVALLCRVLSCELLITCVWPVLCSNTTTLPIMPSSTLPNLSSKMSTRLILVKGHSSCPNHSFYYHEDLQTLWKVEVTKVEGWNETRSSWILEWFCILKYLKTHQWIE